MLTNFAYIKQIVKPGLLVPHKEGRGAQFSSRHPQYQVLVIHDHKLVPRMQLPALSYATDSLHGPACG